MARISGVESPNLLARLFYWMTKRKIGRVILPMKITAHQTRLLWGMGEMEMAQLGMHSVDAALKSLASVKVATLAGCPFWIDIGSAVSRKQGLADAKLRALHEFETSGEFSDLEKLVLRYAVGMTATPVEVSDELFTALRGHFNERQLVELTSAIAWENYRARFDHAFGIESEGFSEGA
jgi:alkylhydroperoxidase family enzyme